MEAGSGFGFGFQVYCGCKLLYTTGGGFGSGMTVSGKAGVAPVMGGLGGGGGVQMFKDGAEDAGKEDKPVLNVGGGGGGDLDGCGGSTDFGQLFPHSSMEEAKDVLIAPQVQACPPEKLSMVGGGGGGMGFTVTGKDEAQKEWVAAYGGGLNLKFHKRVRSLMMPNVEASSCMDQLRSRIQAITLLFQTPPPTVERNANLRATTSPRSGSVRVHAPRTHSRH